MSDLPAAGASAASVNRGYGVHMAVGLSIGFLFLGGACYKFNTSSESVAMLLISMWPVLPNGPSDNRFHLQARSRSEHHLLENAACRDKCTCRCCLFDAQVFGVEPAGHCSLVILHSPLCSFGIIHRACHSLVRQHYLKAL